MRRWEKIKGVWTPCLGPILCIISHHFTFRGDLNFLSFILHNYYVRCKLVSYNGRNLNISLNLLISEWLNFNQYNYTRMINQSDSLILNNFMNLSSRKMYPDYSWWENISTAWRDDGESDTSTKKNTQSNIIFGIKFSIPNLGRIF